MSLETVIGTRDGCWKIDSRTQKVLIFPTKNRSKPQNILSGKCSLIFPLFYRLCSPYKTVIYQSASKQSIEENGNRHLNYSSHKAGQHHFQITVFQFAEFAFSGEKKKNLYGCLQTAGIAWYFTKARRRGQATCQCVAEIGTEHGFPTS